MYKTVLGFSLVSVLFIIGCIETRHEVEVKPMHITIDVNVRVQEELKQKFSKTDQQYKEISEQEAEDALKQYLEQGKTQK